MQYVVYGAGAVGGVIGAHLHLSGTPTTLVARGEHLAAIRRHGLTLDTAEAVHQLEIPTAADAGDVDWSADSVVLLAVKSHQTAAAVADLAEHAPTGTIVVCAQNGVANEAVALRRFARTYAITVMLPATHLEPGVVVQKCHPTPGILDIGGVPRGVDDDHSRPLRRPAPGGLRVRTPARHHGLEVPQAPAQPRERRGRGLPAGRRRRSADRPGPRRGRGRDRGGRDRRGQREAGRRAARRHPPAPYVGPATAGWIDLAERHPRHRQRDRLPLRRDRAARPPARRTDAGERAAAARRPPSWPGATARRAASMRPPHSPTWAERRQVTSGACSWRCRSCSPRAGPSSARPSCRGCSGRRTRARRRS